MNNEQYSEIIKTDILVAGGGAAGMAAAFSAVRSGASVVLAEQSDKLGGILNRCTHHGFGLGYYDEDMTGIGYAEKYRSSLLLLRDELPCLLKIMNGTTVLEIKEDRTALLASEGRITLVSFSVLVLASGSYEKPLESLFISGTRPAGVMTAGCAQGLINEDGQDMGERIVILGSGNVGQIMAGQLADAGKEIVAMIEQNDAPGGLARNVREYIEGRSIPLILNSTVSRIHGSGRICGVTVLCLISGEEKYLACDTLISALGLIPERTLIEGITRAGSMPDWIIAAGNCERIYDFADAVTSSGEEAGVRAAELSGRLRNSCTRI